MTPINQEEALKKIFVTPQNIQKLYADCDISETIQDQSFKLLSPSTPQPRITPFDSFYSTLFKVMGFGLIVNLWKPGFSVFIHLIQFLFGPNFLSLIRTEILPFIGLVVFYQKRIKRPLPMPFLYAFFGLTAIGSFFYPYLSVEQLLLLKCFTLPFVLRSRDIFLILVWLAAFQMVLIKEISVFFPQFLLIFWCFFIFWVAAWIFFERKQNLPIHSKSLLIKSLFENAASYVSLFFSMIFFVLLFLKSSIFSTKFSWSTLFFGIFFTICLQIYYRYYKKSKEIERFIILFKLVLLFIGLNSALRSIFSDIIYLITSVVSNLIFMTSAVFWIKKNFRTTQ
jgi:hypothetical protein